MVGVVCCVQFSWWAVGKSKFTVLFIVVGYVDTLEIKIKTMVLISILSFQLLSHRFVLEYSREPLPRFSLRNAFLSSSSKCSEVSGTVSLQFL